MKLKRMKFLLVFLVLLLGAVNAAWVINYKKSITTQVIGQEKVYNISKEFSNSLTTNTSNGPTEVKTLMNLGNLKKDINLTLEVETRRVNLNDDCLDYDEDCNVIITHIYTNGTEIRKILLNKQTISNEVNFTLWKNIENQLEYKIICVENSCNQRINSNITLQEIPKSF